MAYHSTVGYFLEETINRIRHLLFSSYTTNDYSSFSRAVQVYQVVDFRRDLGADCSYVEHELPGFSMYLDTNEVQNYDKERVIQALKEAAERLRDRVIL